MTVKVLFTVPQCSEYFSKLWTAAADRARSETGLDLTLLAEPPVNTDAWRQALTGYDALLTSWGMIRLDETVLPSDSRLKLVAHAAGSVADLVSPELYRRGIRVASANPVMARSVAEWCLAMTINARMNLLELAGIDGLRPPRWENRYRTAMVEGATIGIWGYGEIARRYVHYLRPFRPERIVVNSNHLNQEAAAAEGMVKGALEEVFDADVVILLAGLSPENTGRIDAALLNRIRPGGALINAGRARLVDEAAWRAAVIAGRFTLYQDVFYSEPIVAEDPVFHAANTLFTPHQAGLSSVPLYVPEMLRTIQAFFASNRLDGEITADQALRMTSHRVAAGT